MTSALSSEFSARQTSRSSLETIPLENISRDHSIPPLIAMTISFQPVSVPEDSYNFVSTLKVVGFRSYNHFKRRLLAVQSIDPYRRKRRPDKIALGKNVPVQVRGMTSTECVLGIRFRIDIL